MWIALLFFGCATKAEVESMQARMDRLDNRIARLEQGTTGSAPTESPENVYSRGREALDQMNYPDARDAFRSLVQDYPNSTYSVRAERHLSELAIIGRDAGDLAVERWFQGYGEFTNERDTFLVFFETWCPHCRSEAPNIQADLTAWYETGVDVVAITRLTRDSTESDVIEFIAGGGVTYPMGYDSTGELAVRFDISGIPAAVMIRDGVVHWRGHPAKMSPQVWRAYLTSLEE